MRRAVTGEVGDVVRTWCDADAVCFDVDSTVCLDEGIHELADFCGAGQAVAQWTAKAMAGSVAFEEALAARLSLFKPSIEQVQDCIEQRPPRISSGIAELIEKLKARNTDVYLVSWGFRQMIKPVALELGVPLENIFANQFPVRNLWRKCRYKSVVMIGDGATDLEARQPSGADFFICYGGVQMREDYMAGRKEKHVPIACQATSGRITRSKAAVSRTRSGAAPSVPLPLKDKQKHAATGKMKRGASDENSYADAGASAPQPKKRMVLKNVTNISCANACKKCTAVTKLQPGPSQKVGQSINKQCSNKIPKLLPLAAGESLFVNDSNSAEETQKVYLLAQKKKQTVLVENKGALPLQNIEQNRDIAFHEAFFEERNARNKLETAALKAGDSDDLNIVDIDKNNVDPQMCVTYVAEIYRNLMASETPFCAYLIPQLIRRPRPNYMETLQRDITTSMRGLLIDWLVEVSEEYKLVADTLYLTVYLIDQFLSQNFIEMQKLQLLGITSMLIASKYEEFCAPSVEEFCTITDSTYQKAEVLEMERKVLDDLGFHLSVPTANIFLRRFLRAAQASCINPTLEYYTSYKSSNIRMCVCALQKLQHNTNNCPLKSIREKYGQQKFECVANLRSPELLQSLFT
ncbi:cyclin-A2-1-like [Panicum miliaceum]|uniref:phosphoserine phosphatase n=1 Tax=Panicum miliaceum TaxID=4540 RepID=A0A3L6SVL0_PANMI|nr:cyclin-A2-1-like [Panicum miliaceum]